MTASTLPLVASGPLPYLLSVPAESASRIGRWPVLCFLHGYDEGAPTEIREGLTCHGPLSAGSSEMAGRFLIIAPQLPERGDVWNRHAGRVHDIVQQVHARYDGDPERTFLTGFSFGGNGVFELALMQRQFWAALWAVDPARVPDADPLAPVWLSSGELSRQWKHAFVTRLGLVDDSENATGDRVYSDGGQDHVRTAVHAYRDDRVYRWLLDRVCVGTETARRP